MARTSEEEEQRFVKIGNARDGRLLVVCHCDRAEHIRL
jgi:uncharacterized DUF497 family protein